MTAVAGRDVAAYFKGNQDRRNVFVDGRSGPDRVPGNLFPAREIYFPGINIPSSFRDGDETCVISTACLSRRLR